MGYYFFRCDRNVLQIHLETFFVRMLWKLWACPMCPLWFYLATQTESNLTGALHSSQEPYQMSWPNISAQHGWLLRVTASSFTQCYFHNSFLNWWARSKNLCEWQAGGLLSIEEAVSYEFGFSRTRSRPGRLLSSSVKAFHCMLSPSPGDFAPLYGSQPSSPS